jgi:hypothetical protein
MGHPVVLRLALQLYSMLSSAQYAWTVAFILLRQRYLSFSQQSMVDHESISRLSQDQLMSMASELGWKYHQTEGVPPFANVSCVVTPQSWNHSWDDCLRLPPGKGPFLRSPVRARDVL